MTDLSTIRSKLIERAAVLSGREDAISVHLRGADGRREMDPEDAASFVANDEVLESLDGAARAEIVEIRAAIARIDAGSYGVCEGCGADIDVRRLEVIPHTRLCVICAGKH